MTFVILIHRMRLLGLWPTIIVIAGGRIREFIHEI